MLTGLEKNTSFEHNCEEDGQIKSREIKYLDKIHEPR